MPPPVMSAAVHPLDVVRTRFQGCDRRGSSLPTYKNTVNAIFTIGRMELWQSQTKIFRQWKELESQASSRFCSRSRSFGESNMKYSDNGKNLSPRLHLVSAAEAGALVCFFAQIQFGL
ncbi:folate transporter 1, chloroplastic-like [Cucurbita pepo subsp. pepo]|uniref:folate transporter 1, chloroplastic-like n=1 Tax=Cucurbita pepo subsp. pepo TaxID=3664 RepID=UPI000C9D7F75|nr:folate transporter 1, chloroplastic-like [Cucurbita pepo subsp. pepo]